MSNLKQHRIENGLCPDCGESSYPYYYCKKHRITRNINRVTKKLEEKGCLDVELDENGEKLYTLKEGVEIESKNFSPKAIKKMQLPRLGGKPMTGNVVDSAILEVLDAHQTPLTLKEINLGVKQLKTAGRVIPDRANLINEFNLIQHERSTLSKAERDAVVFKINFLLQRKIITEKQLGAKPIE